MQKKRPILYFLRAILGTEASSFRNHFSQKEVYRNASIVACVTEVLVGLRETNAFEVMLGAQKILRICCCADSVGTILDGRSILPPPPKAANWFQEKQKSTIL